MIPTDKLLHFFASFVIGLVNPFWAAAAGIGKEIWDELSGGMADVGDLIADGFGIVFAVVVSPWW